MKRSTHLGLGAALDHLCDAGINSRTASGDIGTITPIEGIIVFPADQDVVATGACDLVLSGAAIEDVR